MDGNHGEKHPKTADYVPKGIPFIMANNLIGGTVDYSNCAFISKEQASTLVKGLARPGDVLLTHKATIGRTAIVPNDYDLIILTPQVTYYRVIHGINNRYLKYYFDTAQFQGLFKNWAGSGSTRAYLGITAQHKLPIVLPDIETQRRLASILSSLDDKIEVNRRINENLEQQAQALFKSWFVDFEPFRDGEFVESELGMIPKGWKVGTLSEYVSINPQRPLKKGELSTYLDMKNMPTSGPFPLYCEKKEYSGGMRFQNQDTLMARITPCLENGKVSYVNYLKDDEKAFGSTEYIVMTTKDGFVPELLYFLCRDESFKGYATKNMNGSSGRQRVSGETIGNYKIVIPPKSLLNSIAPYLKRVMDTIKNNGFESRRLAELRDALLPKLMSGELKVNDVSL